VTIHSEHPFETPPADRDVVRQLRGRLVSGVSVWTAVAGERPVGLTVSSILVVDGSPACVLGLVDPDSDLYDAAVASGRVAISVLGGRHQYLADAFGGIAPAPGGAFRLSEWQDAEDDTGYGPVLADASATVHARLVDGEPRDVGWSRLLEAVIEHVEIRGDGDPLVHYRGRYRVL
jgi:flavin reductase (DIM6/NTAB) family NADH-FMN oxidoreductase RutF